MLTLDKPLLKAIQSAARLVAFKDGSRHYLTLYPFKDRWDVMTTVDVPGSRVILHHRLPFSQQSQERGACVASLDYCDVFKLLRVGDMIALEWWPDCNSPWLEQRGLTRDVLRLRIARPQGRKEPERIEVQLAEDVYGADNAITRMCRHFPTPPAPAEKEPA